MKLIKLKYFILCMVCSCTIFLPTDFLLRNSKGDADGALNTCLERDAQLHNININSTLRFHFKKASVIEPMPKSIEKIK